MVGINGRLPSQDDKLESKILIFFAFLQEQTRLHLYPVTVKAISYLVKLRYEKTRYT